MMSRKSIFISLLIFGVISIALIIMAAFFGNKTTPQGSTDDGESVNQNSYYDSNSGETTVSPDGWESEATEDGSSVVILGLPKLTEVGLTNSQVDLLKSIIENYSTDKKVGEAIIDEVSFSNKDISQSRDTPSGEKEIVVTIEINRKYTYTARLHYVGSKDLSVDIYDGENKLVFSS